MINFLSTFLHNPWLLAIGVAALLIPPLIHLLNRRRFDVVEWGAMQFLQISETTRRRLLIEELLLMLLRISLLAVLVFALAQRVRAPGRSCPQAHAGPVAEGDDQRAQRHGRDEREDVPNVFVDLHQVN